MAGKVAIGEPPSFAYLYDFYVIALSSIKQENTLYYDFNVIPLSYLHTKTSKFLI